MFIMKKRGMNKVAMKKSSERKEALMRVVVFFVSGLILIVWEALIEILCLANWIITLVTGARNKGLAEFSEYWNTEIYRFIRYMTAVTNERPFPFNELKRISKFVK